MLRLLSSMLRWLRSVATGPTRFWRAQEQPPEADPSERRRVLGAGAVAVAGAVVGVGLTRRADASRNETLEAPDPGPTTGRRWGMAIDLNRCTGCNGCQIACRQENNVPTQGPEPKYDAGQIEWMSMLWEDSEDAQAVPQLLPFPCQHCHDAPCVKVCPVGATHKDSEGITVQTWDRCIGCRYCMVACPYGRRFFNWEHYEFEGSLVQMLNPDVATRPDGVVEKCTFCSHRLKRVREEARLERREMADEDLRRLPACASACPADAITFGDLNDPDSSVSRLRRSPSVFYLLEYLGTDPNVFYLKRDRTEDS